MIIGIDLGTTNSLVAAWLDGKPTLIPTALGEFLTPSCVSIDEDGQVLVGRAARSGRAGTMEAGRRGKRRHSGRTAAASFQPRTADRQATCEPGGVNDLPGDLPLSPFPGNWTEFGLPRQHG